MIKWDLIEHMDRFVESTKRVKSQLRISCKDSVARPTGSHSKKYYVRRPLRVYKVSLMKMSVDW
jgi:hypothetical protein